MIIRRFIRVLLLPPAVGACSGDPSTPGAAGDPYAALDPRPFGFHPAIAHREDFPDDPYEPAKTSGLVWTRGGEAPYLFWSFVDPERSGDPVKMHFGEIVVPGPEGGWTR